MDRVNDTNIVRIGPGDLLQSPQDALQGFAEVPAGMSRPQDPPPVRWNPGQRPNGEVIWPRRDHLQGIDDGVPRHDDVLLWYTLSHQVLTGQVCRGKV